MERLARHARHHREDDAARCPCCDYACASREQLVSHVQLHFPSAPVDLDALTHMMLSPPNKNASGSSSPLAEASPSTASTATVAAKQESAGDDDDGSRDSTGNNPLTANQPPAAAAAAAGSEKKTRVYACRFCDREFEDKNLMIQHERQHQA